MPSGGERCVFKYISKIFTAYSEKRSFGKSSVCAMSTAHASNKLL